MIYCDLKGGLGNMLFQIAATKAFAMDIGDECCFPNMMANFKINDDDHSPLRSKRLTHSTIEYMQLFSKLNCDPNVDRDKLKHLYFPFHYEPRADITPDTMVHGFFQSEKYFAKYRETILNLFDFSSFIPDSYIKEKYPFIDSGHNTAIHVRRGDYVLKPLCHPPQSLMYYYKGMEILKNDTDNFIVFTDDIEWCKSNFKNAIVIENEKDYVEIYLMSLCNNNIISNSSFGWWGAWLNKNKDKKVIGPHNWFGPILSSHQTHDILPETWIKL